MPEFLRSYLDTLRGLDPRAVIDIAVLTAFIWSLLVLARGTTAMTLLRGAAILLVGLFALANIFDLTVLNWLLRNSLTGVLIAIPIIFQPEIRRALERLGRTGLHGVRDRGTDERVVESLVEAAGEMARRRHGALIVLERETGLQEYIRTGRMLDAALSAELLANLFFRNAPLHDGAVIVRGDRIVAASCTLPLSDAPLPPGLGTRHRAALGLSERTDAVCIVVSEETGTLSVAADGRLSANLDEFALRNRLRSLLGVTENGVIPLAEARNERRASG
jgi:diadenylate cyclase